MELSLENQMTIWEFLEPEKPKSEYPSIIEELRKDLTFIFSGDKCKMRDETYYAWSHVPNLGKRYSVFVEIKSEYAKTLSLAPIIEKYKKKLLEVSISVMPEWGEEFDQSLMISTLWLTKGHKEITE